MFKLVVLSALVAVSMAAPSGVFAPYGYGSPSLTVVQQNPFAPQTIISAVPNSYSTQSNTVFHGARALLAPAPVAQYAAYATPVVQPVVSQAVVGSVPTSISRQSSSIVHDYKPVITAQAVVAAPAPVAVPVAAPAPVQVFQPFASHAIVGSVPNTISQQSSSVVHGSRAVVAQYPAQALQYAPAYGVAAARFSSPLIAGYPGYYNPAGVVASPYIQAW